MSGQRNIPLQRWVLSRRLKPAPTHALQSELSTEEKTNQAKNLLKLLARTVGEGETAPFPNGTGEFPTLLLQLPNTSGLGGREKVGCCRVTPPYPCPARSGDRHPQHPLATNGQGNGGGNGLHGTILCWGQR